MNSIEWLQRWYTAQCNGEWEHRYGLRIESLDNPGWLVTIDLVGTSVENRSMETFTTEQGVNHLGLDGDQNWTECRVDDNRFKGAGGPSSLFRICDVFMQWVESDNSSQAV